MPFQVCVLSVIPGTLLNYNILTNNALENHTVPGPPHRLQTWNACIHKPVPKSASCFAVTKVPNVKFRLICHFVTLHKWLNKKYYSSPFSCFSVRSTTTSFSNIKF